jgi:hypothetical protein
MMGIGLGERRKAAAAWIAEGLDLGKLASSTDTKVLKATLREKSYGEGLAIATTCDY